MFINRALDGRNNVCGHKVRSLRIAKGISQNQLAIELQLLGLNVDKNSIQRLEAGQRFVTDIDLLYLSAFFKVSVDELLDFKYKNIQS